MVGGNIPVAVAVILNSRGEVLVARRALHQHQGGLLEFPGGKIEPGETTEQALVRELKEELGLSVPVTGIGPAWLSISHHYPEKTVHLDIREVFEFEGEPRGQEGQPIHWMPISELATADFPEANAEIIEALKRRTSESRLTHLNERGEAAMVDVSAKPVTRREATAEARVRMQPETLKMVVEGRHKKGDVFAVCRIAGIQAAKRTAELIPLCHSLNLSKVQVDLLPEDSGDSVRIVARCVLDAKTGVEMEALTAASVAALTLYDMCKAVDRGMSIEQVRLLEKSGGRSGEWRAD